MAIEECDDRNEIGQPGGGESQWLQEKEKPSLEKLNAEIENLRKEVRRIAQNTTMSNGKRVQYGLKAHEVIDAILEHLGLTIRLRNRGGAVEDKETK